MPFLLNREPYWANAEYSIKQNFRNHKCQVAEGQKMRVLSAS